ncbi:DNA methylase N-4/N-6 domain-containing protein [Hyphomicrobium denitrificans 1NES1]|uniref:DNA methylase N-4/N-6 domain-containing protein n=1 Tax=Hyphomicrobium denitrificans 1NES1 TaxID=670307 RepID=N0BA29_9HYPH|nr:DNA methylase N-4/N-6 domain-containing protein [Hyphomicrobium denitrificans 1NES1]
MPQQRRPAAAAVAWSLIRYVDVILRRYHEVTGEHGILHETGETFLELAERRMQETESEGQ